MELTAAIEALTALKKPCRVALYTDSTYVRSGITEWLPAWRARGWRTADKKPVKNQDLWQALAELAARHEVAWHWVKGHAGHPENERADELANRGLDEMLRGSCGMTHACSLESRGLILSGLRQDTRTLVAALELRRR